MNRLLTRVTTVLLFTFALAGCTGSHDRANIKPDCVCNEKPLNTDLLS